MLMNAARRALGCVVEVVDAYVTPILDAVLHDEADEVAISESPPDTASNRTGMTANEAVERIVLSWQPHRISQHADCPLCTGDLLLAEAKTESGFALKCQACERLYQVDSCWPVVGITMHGENVEPRILYAGDMLGFLKPGPMQERLDTARSMADALEACVDVCNQFVDWAQAEQAKETSTSVPEENANE